MDYATVDRIVKEKQNYGTPIFTVISGGEPLLWKSDGKDLLDLGRENPDNYFMFYTNGTLIDKKMAARLAEVGNLTPAISVEGFAEETDERRGKGVFKKILEAMANLREVGVPFGISVTATRHNVEKIVSDEFVDFFYDQQGAIYGWIFQYMPIGRSQTLDLMVGIRKWQKDYGFGKSGKDVNNLIAPCGIRDHDEFTRKHLETTKPTPIDESAAEAIQNPEYYKGLTAYNKKFLELTEGIWQKEFIGNRENHNGNGNGKQSADEDNELAEVEETVNEQ